MSNIDKYREEVGKVLEVHQTEWIGHEEGWDCGCNERGYLPAMPSMLDAQNHQAGEVVKVLERALAEQKALGDKVIQAQQTLLAVYRAGGRTPGKALDDLYKYRPLWEQS